MQSLLLYLILIVLVRKGVLRKREILIVSITLLAICFVIGPLESYMNTHPDIREDMPLRLFIINPGTFTYTFIIIYTFLAYLSVTSYNRIVAVVLMSCIYFSFFHQKVFRHWVYLLKFGRSGPIVDKDISHIPPMVMCSELGDSIDIKTMTDKIVVVDVWSQYCGQCFKQFPHFESLKKSWSHDTNIVFYNTYIEYASETLFDPCDIAKEYEFNVLKTDEAFYNSLNINGLPIYYIFKDGRMVFEGNIEELNENIIKLSQ